MSASGSDGGSDGGSDPPQNDRGKKVSTSRSRRSVTYQIVDGPFLPPPSTADGSGPSTVDRPFVPPPGTLEPPEDENGIRSYTFNKDVVRVTRDGRIVAEPVGHAFRHGRVVSRIITNIIRANYKGPWVDWGEVKKFSGGTMWRGFRARMAWYAEQNAAVESAFNTRASHRLSSMLRQVRETMERPTWIGEDDWAVLKDKWRHPDYIAKCEKAKKNRASEKGGCINTGGSINSVDHYDRLEQILGRPPTLIDLYRQLHMREATQEYPDQRHREILQNFEERQARRRALQQSSGSDVDPAEERRAAFEDWQQSVGPTKSGRLVGAGGIGSAFQNSIIPDFSACSSERSTGRSYIPTPEELNAVQRLTQQLSEQQREMQERQAKYEQDMQQMNERLNQFMSMYRPPPMQQPNYGASFQPQQYQQGGYQPLPNFYQPPLYSQPPPYAQPQQQPPPPFQPQQPPQLVSQQQLHPPHLPTQPGQFNSDPTPPLSQTNWFGLQNPDAEDDDDDNNNNNFSRYFRFQ